MNNPLISIIMPMYNSEAYLKEAISSCLNQTYRNIELLIIDDGSQDKSIDIVKELMLSDSRIKLFTTPSNQGPAVARNIGLDNAHGDYITFLDSDDFIVQDKLEKQFNYMSDNNLSMTHGNYLFCDLNGKKIKNVITSNKIDYKLLLKSNQFKIMTVLIKREIIKDLRFPIIKHEDYAFFLDCLKRVGCSYLYNNEFSSNVRVGKISVSSNKLKSALWTFKIYYNKEKLGLLSSLYYFLYYAYYGFLKHKR